MLASFASPQLTSRSATANRQLPIQSRRLTIRAAADSGLTSRCRQAQQQQHWSDLYTDFKAADALTADHSASPAAEVIADDTLARALQLLQQAADAEDYGKAAKLRDASLAWLGGWWRPVSNPQARGINNSSSLLYVSHRDANRWTGLLFTPADFMHFDLQANCNLSELQMTDMLRETRYGTPLFEVFVLPDQQQQQAGGPSYSSPKASDTGSSSSSDKSSYRPVIVALQSVNRGFNELLGVQSTRRRQHPGPSEPRYINQRLLLMVQPEAITAAAVHAGNDSTMWSWHVSTQQQQQGSYSAAVQGPFRPAEMSGGVRTGFTLDWHKIDHLRGPGALSRTGPDSFNFCRQTLPADVLQALSSSSKRSGGGWDGSNVQVFRIDLQYMLPPAEPAAADDDQAADTAAAAAGSSDPSTAEAVSDSTMTSAAAAATAADVVVASAAAEECGWAERVAAELCSLLHNSQAAASTSTSSGCVSVPHLSALLSAAATGTAPAGGMVSEAQQAVSVTQVPLAGTAAAAAATATAGGSSAESAATPAAVEFVRVSEPTAALSFGGWQVTASLT